MVDSIEALRKGTEAIIAENPIDIVFTCFGTVEDEHGNIKRITKKTEVHRVRIAELSHSETEKLIQQGAVNTHSVNITARHDADIQAGYVFDFLGKRFRVEFIRKITHKGYTADRVYKMSGRASETSEAVQ
ncbi:MAG: head-tail adaptor protein [Treponema sp.]